MIKLSLIQRQVNKTASIAKFSSKRKLIRLNLRAACSILKKFELTKLLQQLPRNSISVRSRNRCSETGRGRGYIDHFGLSRNSLKELAGKSVLPGLVKSSW